MSRLEDITWNVIKKLMNIIENGHQSGVAQQNSQS